MYMVKKFRCIVVAIGTFCRADCSYECTVGDVMMLSELARLNTRRIAGNMASVLTALNRARVVEARAFVSRGESPTQISRTWRK